MNSKKLLKSALIDLASGKRITQLDRNLDRNIFLSSRTKFKSYVFRAPIVLDDGTRGMRHIVVGVNPLKNQKDPSKFEPSKINPYEGAGVLTTSHLKAIAALIANWEDKGRPSDKNTIFSFYNLLSNYYDYKQNIGRTDYQYFKKILLDLRTIPITFIDSFESVDEEGGIERLTYPMNVLSDLKIYEKFRKDGQVTMAINTYKLDGRALNNLLGGYTKAILLGPLIKKKGDAAILLYKFTNSVLTDSDRFEITSVGLFDQLELKENSYRLRSNRKQVLERAIKENEGEPIIGGRLHFELKETRDKKDYRLIISKLPAKKGQQVDEKRAISHNLLPDETREITEAKLPFYVFLKEQQVAYPEKVINLSPHTAEVMELIVEDYKEKLEQGFTFTRSPQAWLVAAFKNPYYQPKRLTKTQEKELKRRKRIKVQLREKKSEFAELNKNVEVFDLFLRIDEAEQIKQLVRDRTGLFYIKHRRWPNAQEDKKLLENECRSILPQEKQERRKKMEQTKKKLKQLLKEIELLQAQLGNKESLY